MTQPILTYGMLIFALAGFALAFVKFGQGKTTASLLLIVISGFLLRCFMASDRYLHPWDERYHALVAKNMLHHPLRPTLYENPVLPYDHTNWTANHVWLHKQPAALWMVTASMALFGVNEWALRFPSVLFSTLGILLLFYIARYLYSERVALIAAFLFSIHGMLVELVAGRVPTDHIDVLFLFFITLAIFLAVRFADTGNPLWNVLCGVGIGLAVLTKWLPALIVLPVWLLLVMDSGKFSAWQTMMHGFILCMVSIAIFLPWQIYIFNAFPREAHWENAFNGRHITESIEGQGRPFHYHFDKLRMVYGELIYLPLLWLTWKVWKRPGNYRRLLLLTWFFIPFLFFSLARTKMQAYTLIAAPALFILTALSVVFLLRVRNRLRYRRIVIGGALLLILLPVRYSFERIKPFRQTDRNPKWAQEMRDFGRRIANRENVLVFNVKRPVELMFYASCTAYRRVPDVTLLRGLTEKGFEVYVNEDAFSEFTCDKLVKQPGVRD